jgi:hypothetical protein
MQWVSTTVVVLDFFYGKVGKACENNHQVRVSAYCIVLYCIVLYCIIVSDRSLLLFLSLFLSVAQ